MKKNKTFPYLFILIILTMFALPITYARYAQSFNSTIALNIRQPKYSVAFHSNDSTTSGTATGSMTNELFDYGTPKALTVNSYSILGYNFNSWNTAADGSGTSYSDGQTISDISSVDGYILNLYAQWTQNTFTITYSGISVNNLPSTATYGSTATINFGSTNVIILSVTMGETTINNYTFANNTLTIENVTGNIVITGIEISSDIEWIASADNYSVEEEFSESAGNAITDATTLVQNLHVHAININNKSINKIVIVHEYNIQNGGAKDLNAILTIGNNAPIEQTVNYPKPKKGQVTAPVTITFDNISIGFNQTFSITFEVVNSNNGVINLTKQTITATYSQ